MPVSRRWIQLFVAVRALAAITPAVLLLPERPVAAFVGLAWGLATAALIAARPELLRRPSVWAVDSAAALALLAATGGWRSPYYVLALLTLPAPAASLPLDRALLWGAGFTLLSLASAIGTHSLVSITTHLLLPLVTAAGVAHAADAQRLAVEAERRRIAWELHDSAKQRLHAAALMLSSVDPAPPILGAALQEVNGAAADMETSIAELRMPLEGRPLHVALRERAQGLGPVPIRVHGKAPPLAAVAATHVYRILAEAMVNAARHAHAESIDVDLEAVDGHLRASVTDDGRGVPETTRPGANGLLTMRSRAFAIGAQLTVGRGPDGRGTRVHLDLPLSEGATA